MAGKEIKRITVEFQPTDVQGTFIAAEPKGDFVYTCIDGKDTTDILKHKVKRP